MKRYRVLKIVKTATNEAFGERWPLGKQVLVSADEMSWRMWTIGMDGVE